MDERKLTTPLELQARKYLLRPQHSLFKNSHFTRLDKHLCAHGHAECSLLDPTHFDLEQCRLLLDRDVYRGLPMPA